MTTTTEEISFADCFANKRRELGLSLRKFCKINGLDPGNISKLERGIIPPSNSDDVIEKYATSLNIKKGTDEWNNFFELSKIYSGRIPDQIMSDEEVLKKLPIFFRTLKGKKIDDNTIVELVDKIKNA